MSVKKPLLALLVVLAAVTMAGATEFWEVRGEAAWITTTKEDAGVVADSLAAGDTETLSKLRKEGRAGYLKAGGKIFVIEKVGDLVKIRAFASKQAVWTHKDQIQPKK